MTSLKPVAVACIGMSRRRKRMLASYLLNGRRGRSAVRKMIRDDIDRFADLGAQRYASELTEVLDCFECKFPDEVADKA
jgi:hypothetical protein